MILLDTHTLLWWLAGAELSVHVERLIADRSERVGVSAASVFEIETKRRLGKLRAPADVLGALDAEGFQRIDLTVAEADAAGRLAWDHRDPFDRLLVAQSRVRQAPLATADRDILAFEPSAIAAR